MVNITENGASKDVANSYAAPTSPEKPDKGRIQIVKHTDTGLTKVETPEEGATFEVYLTSAGSYAAAKETERDFLTIDKDGFARTKDLPVGNYTVHQVSGWEGSELIADFTVEISENDQTYSRVPPGARRLKSYSEEFEEVYDFIAPRTRLGGRSLTCCLMGDILISVASAWDAGIEKSKGEITSRAFGGHASAWGVGGRNGLIRAVGLTFLASCAA